MPPDHLIPISPEDAALLDQIRREQGLESIEQAAEWLAKSALRKAARKTTGRGRALYPIGKKE